MLPFGNVFFANNETSCCHFVKSKREESVHIMLCTIPSSSSYYYSHVNSKSERQALPFSFGNVSIFANDEVSCCHLSAVKVRNPCTLYHEPFYHVHLVVITSNVDEHILRSRHIASTCSMYELLTRACKRTKTGAARFLHPVYASSVESSYVYKGSARTSQTPAPYTIFSKYSSTYIDRTVLLPHPILESLHVYGNSSSLFDA